MAVFGGCLYFFALFLYNFAYHKLLWRRAPPSKMTDFGCWGIWRYRFDWIIFGHGHGWSGVWPPGLPAPRWGSTSVAAIKNGVGGNGGTVHKTTIYQFLNMKGASLKTVQCCVLHPLPKCMYIKIVPTNPNISPINLPGKTEVWEGLGVCVTLTWDTPWIFNMDMQIFTIRAQF